MTDTSMEASFELIFCIQSLVQFRQKINEDKDNNIKTLINLGNEVNPIHPAYAIKLGFHIRKVNVSVQKIDRSHLDIFIIVIVNCLFKNKLGRVQFFPKTLLLGNISLEVVLKMLFLIFSRA